MKRQEFLRQLSLLTGSTMLQLEGINLKAMANSPFRVNMEGTNGKVLVLIQMQGGNDGLNTIIPTEDDNYYNARKTVNIAKSAAIGIRPNLGLHPAMTGLKGLYDQGKVAIVQNVGYAQPDRSHFRATDIWLSASDSKQYLAEGWLARYLEQQNTQYPETLPNAPMAIQLGSVESMLLQGKFGSLGTVFDDPNLFYQLLSGSSVDNDTPPNTLAGNELKFLRSIAAASITYSAEIKTSADKGKNTLTYPNTNLGKQLAIVAKLVAGGLQTPVYLTTIGGFDTHANQLNAHNNLLKQVSDAITAFQTDLQNQAVANNVVVMTFSEFGRRVKENDTSGTDHGTAAPLFVVGNSVKGGVLGANPSLTNLDKSGDILHEFDYRQIYSSILGDYFGASSTQTKELLLKDFNKLPIFKTTESGEKLESIALLQNTPNPVHAYTKIAYSTSIEQDLQLKLINMSGQTIAVLASGTHKTGVHTVALQASQLPRGIYAYSLVSGTGERLTKRMMVD
jgi:uncharacterized protein (DUF1501 family)